MQTALAFSYISLCVLTFLPQTIIPAPVQIDYNILEFLQNYGFLKRPSQGTAYLFSIDAYQEGIRRMQEFYNIPVSGVADKATKSLLFDPRCGTADVDENEAKRGRQKRFVQHGAVWSRVNLKYYIKSRTKDLPKNEVDKGVETALQKWSAVSTLTFQRVKSEAEADITFLWATNSHGDVSAFDGPGGSLAHAFYPDAGGDVHVDDDENWSIEIDSSKHNLIHVVTHEIGHSLGLRHSSDKSSMMYAYINRHRVKLDLNEDDIAGIQKIYGYTKQAAAEATTNIQQTTTNKPATTDIFTRKETVNPFRNSGRKATQYLEKTTRPTSFGITTFSPFQRTQNPFLSLVANPSFCDIMDEVDAAIKIDDSIYLFWKSQYFKTNGGLDKGYPREISSDWGPLPNYLDAALHWPEDATNSAKYMFFKGSQIWFFNKNTQFENVTSINSYFGGRLPDNIDSAFVRTGRYGSQTYFSKGPYYYTTRTHDVTGISGPYPTINWGFSSGLNAAFTFDPIATYFFVGKGYYASDALDDSMQVNFRFYPRQTAQWWLSCR